MQDENDAWYAREAALKDQKELVVACSYAEQMRRLYKELVEHTAFLQEEAEDLSMQVTSLEPPSPTITPLPTWGPPLVDQCIPACRQQPVGPVFPGVFYMIEVAKGKANPISNPISCTQAAVKWILKFPPPPPAPHTTCLLSIHAKRQHVRNT